MRISEELVRGLQQSALVVWLVTLIVLWRMGSRPPRFHVVVSWEKDHG